MGTVKVYKQKAPAEAESVAALANRLQVIAAASSSTRNLSSKSTLAEALEALDVESIVYAPEQSLGCPSPARAMAVFALGNAWLELAVVNPAFDPKLTMDEDAQSTPTLAGSLNDKEDDNNKVMVKDKETKEEEKGEAWGGV